MNQRKFVFSFAWIVALLVATPAMGQLNHRRGSAPYETERPPHRSEVAVFRFGMG